MGVGWGWWGETEVRGLLLEYVKVDVEWTLREVPGEMEGIHIIEEAFLCLEILLFHLDSVALFYLLLQTPLLPLSPLNREPV